MIFLDITINNLYSFDKANLNLSYPRRNKNNPLIENEFLDGRENFRYKRVVIISGANASGKTAFGRVLCAINNFIAGKDVENSLMSFQKAIKNKKKKASFSIYFVTPFNCRLNYLKADFDYEIGLSFEEFAYVDIGLNDSYESAKENLDKKKERFTLNVSDVDFKKIGFRSIASMKGAFEGIDNCWSYLFCQNTDYDKDLHYQNTDTKILKRILQDFDGSISDVFYEKSNSTINIRFDDGYVASIKNGDMNDDDKNRLSRGTFEAIQSANFMEYLMRNPNCVYFFDEKLSYAHSELEQSVLNLMIGKLGRNAQLFYTTHNYDILDMNVPHHSYLFMKKGQFIYPESKVNQNDRSLLNYVRNDVFNTLPQTPNIDSLL